MFDTNVHGLFNMVSAFTPLLMASGSVQNSVPPVIINTASILARVPFPFSAAYNASKAAVAVFSDALRIELEPLGIKVVTFMGEVRTRLKSPEDISFGSEGIYSALSDEVKDRRRNHAENSMSPEEFAAHAVKEILIRSPGYGRGEYLWKGTNAWLIWFLDAVGWRGFEMAL
jgi:1-acylglycerone phosphate reductase